MLYNNIIQITVVFSELEKGIRKREKGVEEKKVSDLFIWKKGVRFIYFVSL